MQQLKGAVLKSAVEAAEKRLPAAIEAVAQAQQALDTALINGAETKPARTALAEAQKVVAGLKAQIETRQAQIAQRQQDRIDAAAAGLIAAAHARIQHTLTAYQFSL
jgi:t-SNARE complex subunit (syntaxin)